METNKIYKKMVNTYLNRIANRALNKVFIAKENDKKLPIYDRIYGILIKQKNKKIVIHDNNITDSAGNVCPYPFDACMSLFKYNVYIDTDLHEVSVWIITSRYKLPQYFSDGGYKCIINSIGNYEWIYIDKPQYKKNMIWNFSMQKWI
jgi:hypothetical protein